MKLRIAMWAATGFLVAGGWAVYFLLASKDRPIGWIVAALARLTCPVAIFGSHPMSVYLVLGVNVATYALAGLAVEIVRQQLRHTN